MPYLPAVEGEFVWDDELQVVQNQLIQHPRFYARAMTSDVWAFRMDQHLMWKSYWRPVFTAWTILNYRLFGLETLGWNLAVIGLHVAVSLLGFRVLRRLGADEWLAGAAALLFAVHPVHVESVSWISGITDPLCSAFFLTALLLVLRLRERPNAVLWGLSLLCYVLAVLAKETAILFPILVFLSVLWTPGRKHTVREALTFSLPFVVATVVYAVARTAVLGGFVVSQRQSGFLQTALAFLLTLPDALVFYLRQLVFPVYLSPQHPLRMVEAGNISWTGFLFSFLLILAAGLLLRRFIRDDRLAKYGLAMLVLPLVPALNFAGFLPERIVHDRYLYLPVLGAALLFFRALQRLFTGPFGWAPGRVSAWVAALALLLAVPLAAKTISYSFVWFSDEVLWTHAAEFDPQGVSPHVAVAKLRLRQKRVEEARVAIEKAYSLAPFTADVLLCRADIALAQQRYEDALADIRFFEMNLPDAYVVHDMYGAIYGAMGQTDKAVAAYRRGRELVPAEFGRATYRIGLILYRAGRVEEAKAELEIIRERVRADTSAQGKLGLFLLGEIYKQAGMAAESRAVFDEFLALSALDADPDVVRSREALLSTT